LIFSILIINQLLIMLLLALPRDYGKLIFMSERLTPSADSKVDPRVDDRYYMGKRVPIGRSLNAFGLSSGVEASCPGATVTCETDCYAINLEQRPAIAKKLRSNLDLILGSSGVSEMVELIQPMVEDYSDRADRLNLRELERMFRIHWAGDFVNEEYAEAWSIVIQRFNDIDFTAYTRTWPRLDPETKKVKGPNVLPILAGIPNLSLYMSVDKDNIWDAEEPYREHYKGLRLAFLDKDYSRSMRLARAMASLGVPDLDPDDKRSLIMCPSENPYTKTIAGKMLELVNIDRRDIKLREEMEQRGETPRRKNPNYRGACVDCRVCYGKKNRHVVFADVHQMHVKSTGHHDGQGDFGFVGTGPVQVSLRQRVQTEKVPLEQIQQPTLF
jgi:hypothetical protein